MPQPIDVWFWPTPNGVKVTIALEEMDLPYMIRPLNIGRGDQFKPEFQAINPNGRMPAIVDPEPIGGGGPLSLFESGAILQYLARKSGRFGGEGERGRVKVEQWLMWQMGGFGPMLGQAHHFRGYAPAFTADQRHLAYGANRYTNEAHRLYGVLDRALGEAEYVAGEYSIADMAIWPWAQYGDRQGVDRAEFPNVFRWFEAVKARPSVQAGARVGENLRQTNLATAGAAADAQRSVLFGQRARLKPAG